MAYILIMTAVSFPGGPSGAPANAGDIRDVGSIPGPGRSPGEGHGNPLQYSCPGNPIDRGAWWATVHVVTKELDLTERLSTTTNSMHHARAVGWVGDGYMTGEGPEGAHIGLESRSVST